LQFFLYNGKSLLHKISEIICWLFLGSSCWNLQHVWYRRETWPWQRKNGGIGKNKSHSMRWWWYPLCARPTCLIRSL
jgi:hypothetical protein